MTSVLAPIATFVLSQAMLSAAVWVFLQRAKSVAARRAGFAVCLLCAGAAILSLIFAAAPSVLENWRVITAALLVIGTVAFFTTRFCPSCGRAISLNTASLAFTHCPYCGERYRP